MTRILITGASGFIGKNLFDHLTNEGYDVYGLYCNTKPSKPDQNMYYCDLNKFSFKDIKKCFDKIQPDTVIHAAAISSPASSKSPEEFLSINIGATEKICRLLPDKRLVFLSSVTTYGNSRGCKEDTTLLKPTSLYAASKVASESIINSYKYINNLSPTILRLCSTIGKDGLTHGMIKDLKEKVKSEKCELFGHSPGSCKPALHIIDLCNFAEKILAKKYGGQVYNVCPDDNISVLECKRIFDPENKCEVTWRPDMVYKGDNKIIRCNNDKMRELYKMYYPTSEATVRSLIEEENE